MEQIDLSLLFHANIKIMLFNSVEFAIFLTIVFLLYWFVCDKWLPTSATNKLRIQNVLIVVASYVFYGWWDWHFLLLIAFTSFCSYLSGIYIQQYRNHKQAKFYLWGNVVVNLSVLGVYKYYDFFAGEFARFFGIADDSITLHLILPVGISFYTFQALSYSIDVYRDKLKPTRNLVEFMAYVSFFPQLVAGPIERATNLLPQFQRQRTFNYSLAVDGMRQILWGLFKKTVIADRCALYVDQVWSAYNSYNSSTLVVAAILFAVQIYCDFSGYSDIAIGSAKLFGIRLMQNFRVPYFSRNIAEFWRRWHISLTTWFRDYVYIPLGGSRCKRTKIVRNTLVIFILSGLWHGANWTFILWGAYNALLFLPLILLGVNRKYTDVVAEGRALPSGLDLLRIITTFALVVFGWIIFRAPDITNLWGYLCAMFSGDILEMPWSMSLESYVTLLIALTILVIAMWCCRDREHGLSFLAGKSKWLQVSVYYALILLITYNMNEGESFIYFQF